MPTLENSESLPKPPFLPFSQLQLPFHSFRIRRPTNVSPSKLRQNDSRLSELSSKVSALRGVTVDIYDNARSQDVIDSSVRPPPIVISFLFP